MNIIFCGSSDFSIPVLQALCHSSHRIVMVVTTPDQKKGRGQKIAPSIVKSYALQHELPCMDPERLRDPAVTDRLRPLQADFLVIASYGKLLPPTIFELPRMASLNVHPSLLPRHRGATPIQRTLLEGDAKTGVSIAEVTAELDAGDIFEQRETPVDPDENAQELSARLAVLGGEMILSVINGIVSGQISRTPQDDRHATYASKFEKDSGRIDWKRSAVSIHNLVRACTPWPAAFTHIHGKRLKVLTTRLCRTAPSKLHAGGIVSVSSEHGLLVQTGAGMLALTRVQLEGRREMSGYDFALGRRIPPGDSLEAV